MGRLLLATLRQDTATHHILVVLISGRLTEAFQRDPDVLQWGVDAAFPKPFNIHQLLQAVDRILRITGDVDIALIALGKETRDLDYKECLDLASKKEISQAAQVGIRLLPFGKAAHPRG